MTISDAIPPRESEHRHSHCLLSQRVWVIMSVRKWVTTLKGLDSLYQEEAAMPTPGKGEVLVEVSAVSLNYRDTEGIASP